MSFSESPSVTNLLLSEIDALIIKFLKDYR